MSDEHQVFRDPWEMNNTHTLSIVFNITSIYPLIHFLFPLNTIRGRGCWSLSRLSLGERWGTPWAGDQSVTLVHIPGQWEEAGQNPCIHGKNMQTRHRKGPTRKSNQEPCNGAASIHPRVTYNTSQLRVTGKQRAILAELAANTETNNYSHLLLIWSTWLQTVGGNWSTSRKSMHRQEEHADFTRKGRFSRTISLSCDITTTHCTSL